ncbi:MULTISPECIES: hypothetical protein [Frankia]|uniref:hypothetical protein n=1 Tax=Frankia TaxID=1854 RepID=UPI0002D49A4E|nr:MULTISPECIES: hypothetical protein [Frankia]ETA02355.1 hypothetical protein CcI6DRAFT_02149 [Frankia sp. CcI6]KDA44800.1 hypothetical protein BMG523Draft_00322 [Frankia sp. BMG5.23]OAA24824.1 hypothetical protein AAY23_104449 [Frankia casuarinae]
MDAGRIVQRGPRRDLIAMRGVYQRLHRSWAAGVGTGAAGGPSPGTAAAPGASRMVG